jgi:predicted kinase
VRGTLLICHADSAVVKTRLEKRRGDVSDADWAIYLQATQRWEPPGPGTQQLCQTIETGRDHSSSLLQSLQVLRRLELWDL